MNKLLLLLLLMPFGLLAQDYYHYPSKNDEGKYGILRRDRATEITDTLVPFEYLDIWKADGYFVLIDSNFIRYKDGEAYGSYYKGRVVNEDLLEIRKFDTIQKLPYLTGPDHRTFKFKEGGKEGFFSGAFIGQPWTNLYDEIDITREKNGGLESDIETPGYKWKRCGIIARSGDKKTLIGPLGDTIVVCTAEDSISIWHMRYFEITDKKTGASNFYKVQGELVEEDITTKSYSSGPGSTIYIFSHLDGQQSLWTGFGQRMPPVPYELDIHTLDGDKFVLGKNDKGEYYQLNWKGKVMSGPYEGYLKLFDTQNEVVKLDGKWRLNGPNVGAYQDVVFDSIATLTNGRSLRNYAFYTKDETVIVSVGAKRSRSWGGHFWSARVKGNTIEVVDGVITVKNNGLWARLTTGGMTEYLFDQFEVLPHSYKYMKARINGRAVLVNDEGIVLFNNLNLLDIEAHNCEVGPMYELTGIDRVGYYLSGMDQDKVELIYDDVECGSYGYCVKKGKKWGLIDDEGKLMKDFKYKLKKVQYYEPGNH